MELLRGGEEEWCNARQLPRKMDVTTLTPWECRYSTVLQIVCRTELASLSEKNFCLRILSSSSPPRISSVTRYTYFPSSYTYQSKHRGVNPKVLPQLLFGTCSTEQQTEISNAELALGTLFQPRATPRCSCIRPPRRPVCAS